MWSWNKNNQHKTKMRCSVCQSRLEYVGHFVTEDIMGSRVIEDQYECKNHPAVCWGHNGELYENNYEVSKEYDYIDGLTAAFGSIGRKLEVQCYKHDEDRCFKITKRHTIKLEVGYKADEDGNILRRYYHFRWLIDNTYYTPQIISLIRGLYRMHKRVALHLLNIDRIEFHADHLFHTTSFFYKDRWGDRWAYRLLHNYGSWLRGHLGV